MVLEFFPHDHHTTSDFKGHTVILPVVSVGNVGQLAVDVLLATGCTQGLGIISVGSLASKAVAPVTGYESYDRKVSSTPHLCSSLEVYQVPRCKVTIIQQRAPVLKGHSKSFVTEVVEWCKSRDIQRLILLSGADPGLREDVLSSTTRLRFITSPPSQELGDVLDRLGHCSPEIKGLKGGEEEDFPSHSGLCRVFYGVCRDKYLPLMTLLCFCNEGDNAQDGMALADVTERALDLFSGTNWQQTGGRRIWDAPASWDCLYGIPTSAGEQQVF